MVAARGGILELKGRGYRLEDFHGFLVMPAAVVFLGAGILEGRADRFFASTGETLAPFVNLLPVGILEARARCFFVSISDFFLPFLDNLAFDLFLMGLFARFGDGGALLACP